MTEPLSGAQFAREVGTDPKKWAERFLAAYDDTWPEGIRTKADQVAFVAAWFRDAMEVAVKAAPSLQWDRQYSPEELKAAAEQIAREIATDPQNLRWQMKLRDDR